MRKYDITVEVRENGVYFYHYPEVIKIDTQAKMEEINKEIKEILQTPEEKEKIEQWNKQLIQSFEEIKNRNQYPP